MRNPQQQPTIASAPHRSVRRFHAASQAASLIVTATGILPTGLFSRFPFLLMDKDTKYKDVSVTKTAGSVATDATANCARAAPRLLARITVGECRATILTVEDDVGGDFHVWYALTFERCMKTREGSEWSFPTFGRESLRSLRGLLDGVEDFLADVDREVDLYGRSLPEVLAEIRERESRRERSQ